MLLQFIEAGVYKTNSPEPPLYEIIYQVIKDGKVVSTTERLTTALIELAEVIDQKIGIDV